MYEDILEKLNANPFIEHESIPWEVVSDKVKRKIMVYDENVMMVCVAFQKGGIGEVHSHHHMQMTYIDSGKFEVEIDNKKQILKRGDTFYIPTNSPHGVRCIEDGILVDIFHPVRKDFLV